MLTTACCSRDEGDPAESERLPGDRSLGRQALFDEDQKCRLEVSKVIHEDFLQQYGLTVRGEGLAAARFDAGSSPLR